MKNKLVIYGARKLALVCFGQHKIKIMIKMKKNDINFDLFQTSKSVFSMCGILALPVKLVLQLLNFLRSWELKYSRR